MEQVVTPRVHIGNVIRKAIVFNLRNSPGNAVTADNSFLTVSRFVALTDER